MSTEAELMALLSKLPKDKRLALEEALKNKDKVAAQIRFDLEKILFDKQLEVARSNHKKKVIVSSRRAGKSYFIASYLLYNALHNPRSKHLYIGLTKASARNVVWGIFRDLIDDYQLPCKANDHTLRIEFNNRAIIMIEGAKDQTSVERIRGNALNTAILDEAQGFSPLFAKALVEEILLPALGDYNGEMILAGTPDASMTSILHKAWVGEKGFENFEKFHWNVTHNIKFPRFLNGLNTPENYLAHICKDTGLTVSDPQFIREYLGEFVQSDSEQVYSFDPERDYADSLPSGHIWNYVISCDPGYTDSDAIVVCAFARTHPIAYCIDCYSKAKEDISEFMFKIMEMREKYEGAKVILDSGGGGLKIVEELNNRYKVGAKPAQKYNPKAIGCSIVSSEFRKCKLKLLNTTEVQELGHQLQNITWRKKINRQGVVELVIPDGKDVKGSTGGVIGDDLADAFLYAIKYLQTYNYQSAPTDLSPQQRLALAIDDHMDTLSKAYKEDQDRPTKRDWFL